MNTLMKLIIRLAFNLLEKAVINRIKNINTKEVINVLLIPVRRIAEALTDKDPDNEEQLKQIWIEHRMEVAQVGYRALQQKIQEIKDPILREGLAESLETVWEGVTSEQEGVA